MERQEEYLKEMTTNNNEISCVSILFLCRIIFKFIHTFIKNQILRRILIQTDTLCIYANMNNPTDSKLITHFSHCFTFTEIQLDIVSSLHHQHSLKINRNSICAQRTLKFQWNLHQLGGWHSYCSHITRAAGESLN